MNTRIMVSRRLKGRVITFLFFSIIVIFITVQMSVLTSTIKVEFPKPKNNSLFDVLLKGLPIKPFQDIEIYNISELEPMFVPNTVHYVWCHPYTIKYQHYLSILSIWKFMRPDIIEFHYYKNITDDGYNMWLPDLRKQIPGFVMKKMPENWDMQEYGCGVYFGIAVLHDRGGIYIAENITLLKSLRHYRHKNFTVGIDTRVDDISFIMSIRRNEKLKHLAKEKYNKDLTLDSFENTVLCEIYVHGRGMKMEEVIPCVVLPDLYPADIMKSENIVGEIARMLYYGSLELIETKTLLPGMIPKYIHLVWYHSKEMTFMMYLSIRSALDILKPWKVFIHGDNQLKGEYFNEIKKDSRVVLVYREIPQYIYGNRILFTQHRSDIIRADVLLKYGGIYMDWDVLWLKPIDDLIQTGYDAIVTFDHNTRNGYPNSMNLGVFMAKQNSDFVRYWQQSLINYRSRDFFHNALELPYKIFEKYPHTVHIEPHLQVMCFQLKCHPLWHSQFRNLDKDQPFDWRNESYSIHFTHPDPPEFQNEAALRKGTGRFASIGKYILSKSKNYTNK